jgi:phosphate transport system substrate-binding protein
VKKRVREPMGERQRVALRMLGGTVGVIMLIGMAGGAAAEHAGANGRPVVDTAIGSYTAKGGVSGGLAITGSDTMQPIVAKIASAFREWQPDVKIAVQGGGTDAALLGFFQNQSTIRRGDGSPKGGHHVSGGIALLAASRPLTQQEHEDFQSRYGYDVTEIPIALDAIAVYVNRQNPIEGIALEQLDAIFSRDRKRGWQEEITTWGQLGLKDEWSQHPIHRYGQDKRSGTRAIFIQKVLQDGNLRPDVHVKTGPASAILALSQDVLGIGYASIGFQASTVRILPLAERVGAAFVSPSPGSVANGTYPLSRPLYLYAKIDPKTKPDPAVLEFLKFVNSRQGQDMVVKAGAYPLPARQVTKNLELLIGTTMAAVSVPTVIN